MYLFLYAPIIILIIFSFNDSKLNAVWEGFTFKWYGSLFQNAGIMEALKNTLIVAVISTAFSVVLGTLVSIGMYRYKFLGKGIVDSLLYVPVVIPEIVMGIAMLIFFSNLDKIPGLNMLFSNGLVVLIIAHITFSVSYVVSVVRARLAGFDRALEEAAQDLGATPFQTFFKITLPIIMPGIVSGAMMAFTLSLDDVIISFFVAKPGSTTLPLKIFSMVKFGVSPEINALSTIMMIATVILVVLSTKLKNVHLHVNKTQKILIAMFLVVVTLTSLIYFPSIKGEPKKALNVFNWSEYLPQSVIDKFEDRYNIKINYNTFSSNEEMLAKIIAGGSNYDIAVASDFMVEIMIKQGLLDEINKDKLSNLQNIGKDFMNLPFDPENKYSIPYMWLAGIIAYDASKVSEPVTGYSDLWRSEFKESLAVLDDPRVIIGMIMKKNGYLLNETSDEALKKAKEDFVLLQKNIKAYDSDSPKTLLINGEAKAIFAWGAEGSLAKRNNENVKLVIPKEGLFLQQDNFVIPKGAKNIEEAELFMNFIMEPEISAEISYSFPYGNPNIEAYNLIDPSIMNDPAIYPPTEDLKKGEYLRDIGDKVKLIDEIWNEVKK